MAVRIVILPFLVACGSPAPPSAPIANTEPVPPVAPPAPVAPTCVRASSGFSEARIAGDGIDACYYMPQQGKDSDDCWRFDLTARTWSFTKRQPHAELPEPVPQVTATATLAKVCKTDGSDCKAVPLSGITVTPDDRIEGATNADRSIVAVWTSTGAVHTFEVATGKRLATVKPWHTAMGPGPSVFRSAHVLGSVLEVRITDTPISSAIRLYEARTARKIADVANGDPMEDEDDPVPLGGTQYAFMTIDTRSIVVVDVVTGREVARYPLGNDLTLARAVLARVGSGLGGVVATTAFVVDGSGKVATVTLPGCPD